jgi:hypothetical protein
MSDANRAIFADIPRRPTTIKANVATKDGRRQINRKLKASLDSMVWDGLPWKQAAERNNYRPSSMRSMLNEPHVITYLKQQRDVFRASLCAGNLLRLGQIRDQDDNRNAAVSAIKVLERIDEQPVQAANSTPGMVIVVVNQPPMPNESKQYQGVSIDNALMDNE